MIKRWFTIGREIDAFKQEHKQFRINVIEELQSLKKSIEQNINGNRKIVEEAGRLQSLYAHEKRLASLKIDPVKWTEEMQKVCAGVRVEFDGQVLTVVYNTDIDPQTKANLLTKLDGFLTPTGL